MTKEERQVQIKKGCNTIINIWLAIFVASFVLLALGMLWEKWSRPPQSWFLTNRRMTDLSVRMSLFSDRYRELATQLPRADEVANLSRFGASLGGLISLDGTPAGEDTAIRTQGLWLSRVLDLPKGGEVDEKYLLPSGLIKRGLVRDHDEWVLNDFWGEPYYVIFDTNKDKKIINPEHESAKIRPDRARQDNREPPPPVLELSVPPIDPWFIYSSGPDRDAQTWDDNVIAWESYRRIGGLRKW